MRMDKKYSLKMGMEKFKEILEKYTLLFKSHKLNVEEIKYLSQDVRNIIHILHERHDYWDKRRELFLQIGLGMMAFGIAGVAAFAAVFEKFIVHTLTFILMATLLLVLISFIIGGIQIIRVWNRQNNPDYPFTKGYKYWRWQYRYAEEKEVPFRYRYKSKADFEEDIGAYLNNLYSYAEKTLDLKPMDVLEQDISQLFLLIENEKYKIKFVSELRDTFSNQLKISFWVGFASVIIFSVLSIFNFDEILKSNLGC